MTLWIGFAETALVVRWQVFVSPRCDLHVASKAGYAPCQIHTALAGDKAAFGIGIGRSTGMPTEANAFGLRKRRFVEDDDNSG